jgi:hypothetical protein
MLRREEAHSACLITNKPLDVLYQDHVISFRRCAYPWPSWDDQLQKTLTVFVTCIGEHAHVITTALAEEQLDKHSPSRVPENKPQYAGSLASFSLFLQQLFNLFSGLRFQLQATYFPFPFPIPIPVSWLLPVCLRLHRTLSGFPSGAGPCYPW